MKPVATVRSPWEIKAMALQDERDRYRDALERISEYETDWTTGPAGNVARLQDIADRALAASPPISQPSEPTAAFFTSHNGPTCPECGSFMIPHVAEVGLKCVNCGVTQKETP